MLDDLAAGEVREVELLVAIFDDAERGIGALRTLQT